MAFSTQKEFFHVPFMNETVDFECGRGCVKLKSYESTVDDRSWAIDEALQSKFLSDLVTCQLPTTLRGDYDNYDDDYAGERDAGQTARSDPSAPKRAGRPGGLRGRDWDDTGGGGLRGRGEPSGRDIKGAPSGGPRSAPSSRMARSAPSSKMVRSVPGSKMARSGPGTAVGRDDTGMGVADGEDDVYYADDWDATDAGGGVGGAGYPGTPSVRGPGTAGPASAAGGVSRGGPPGAVGRGGPPGAVGRGGPSAASGRGMVPGVASTAGARSAAGAPSAAGVSRTAGVPESDMPKDLNDEGPYGELGVLGADSVVIAATTDFQRLEDILLDKKTLQKELAESQEKLRTAKEENEKIKNIMSQKFDKSHTKDFYNKIQKLASGSKMNKDDENELLHIYNKMEDMAKAHEVLAAENAYLKRLLEKLQNRAHLDSIKVDPEKSDDVAYLQNELDKMRKEVAMLRKFEDEAMKVKVEQRKPGLSDQDANSLRNVLSERNALREKLKNFKELEDKIQELQHKVTEADGMSGNLSGDLEKQNKYICEMEEEMCRMQNYYEGQIQKMKFNEEVMKCQLDEMKEDLIRSRCDAQKADCLQMEVSCLRNEITRRDVALSDYDAQYKQLMFVVDELQRNTIQNLQDTQTQTCTEHMEDLAFFASATLSEISKEVKKGNLGTAVLGALSEYGDPSLHTPAVQAEMSRQFDVIKQLQEEKKLLEESLDKTAEELCSDMVRQLRDLQEAHDQLKEDAGKLSALNNRLTAKLDTVGLRLTGMDEEMTRSATQVETIGRDLRQSIQLVKEISDVQSRNQQLADSVSAIRSRDDQRVLDELKKQLAEEKRKNKQCREENEMLSEALRERGVDVDKLLESIQPTPKLSKRDIAKGKKEVSKKGRVDTSPSKATVISGRLSDRPSKLSDRPSRTADRPSRLSDRPSRFSDGARYSDGTTRSHVQRSKSDSAVMRGKVSSRKPSEKSPKETGKGAGKGAAVKGDKTPGAAKGVGKDASVKDAGKGVVGKGAISADDAAKPVATKVVDFGKGDSSARAPGVAERAVRKADIPQNETRLSADPYQDFIYNKASSMMVNLKTGSNLEKELRDILNTFMQECGFCFCKTNIPKSKFYALCHKLLHYGLSSLVFKELAYMHKKIFVAADKIHPGTLLSLIYAEHGFCEVREVREVRERECEQQVVQKCCSCKNTLCCSKSEEVLKQKVCNLEREIEMAREYLDSIKVKPSSPIPRIRCTHRKSHMREQDDDDCACGVEKDQTYRSRPKRECKHIKNLKARNLKYTELV